MNQKSIFKLAKDVSEEQDSDILILSGPINSATWIKMAELLHLKKKKKKNIILILVTPGGDPDAAFRIGRCLQREYNGNVTTYITGWCKSAGTLIALASKKIIMGYLGELGPLDIQIARHDELFESSSGLLVASSLETLETTAVKMFINSLVGIRGQIGRGITTRTASELAATMVADLLKPIYSQIDPARIGEDQRAMNITKNYGARLAQRSKILKGQQSLDFLVSAYPDHGFVIDYEEAKGLFTDVSEPTESMEKLATQLGHKALLPIRPANPQLPAELEFLNVESDVDAENEKVKNETPEAATSKRGRRATGNGARAPGKRTAVPSNRGAGRSNASARGRTAPPSLPSPESDKERKKT